MTASQWVAIGLSGAALLISLLSMAKSYGRQQAELQETRKLFEEHRRENAEDISASRAALKELREFLGAVKEFSREQAAVNQAVARTLDSVTARLESVGDLVMQHKAIIELHTEVLGRKGFVTSE
jgi:hypothetical protein